MNVGLAKRARKTPGSSIAQILGKGTPGTLGPPDAAANPKDVSKEAQAIRLSRLLLSRRT